MSQEEIQEVAEATSPNRAAPLKAFESQYLDALDKTAQSNSLTKFTPAYDSTIAGCNSCHRVSSSDEFPSYKVRQDHAADGP